MPPHFTWARAVIRRNCHNRAWTPPGTHTQAPGTAAAAAPAVDTCPDRVFNVEPTASRNNYAQGQQGPPRSNADLRSLNTFSSLSCSPFLLSPHRFLSLLPTRLNFYEILRRGAFFRFWMNAVLLTQARANRNHYYLVGFSCEHTLHAPEDARLEKNAITVITILRTCDFL